MRRANIVPTAALPSPGRFKGSAARRNTVGADTRRQVLEVGLRQVPMYPPRRPLTGARQGRFGQLGIWLERGQATGFS